MLKRIYGETENYLQRLQRAANEGRAVDEANNFLRWLQFSGVCKLLEAYSFIEPKFGTLRGLADDVQETCRPWLQGRIEKPSPNLARVDELNNKMDVLLSMFAKAATAKVEGPLQITDVGGKP